MITQLLVIGICLGIALKFLKGYRKQENIPPGPWGLPILGHLPFLGGNPCLTFLKWKTTYGPIFSIRFGSIPVVVLNDLKVIKEAFSLDSMSGRPHLTNFMQVSDSKGIALVDGPRSLEQRKFAMKSLKVAGLGKNEFEFRIQEEISQFLSKLKVKCEMMTQKKFPMRINHFFRIPVLNSITTAIVGSKFEEHDPKLQEFFDIVDRSSDINSTVLAQLCWFFPWVARVLGFLGLNHTITGFKQIYDYIEDLIHQSRKDHTPGEPKHFTHAYFDQVEQTKDPNSSFYKGLEQRYSTGDIFMGALETANTTMDWLLIYMARAPHIQRQLQAEIDNVLGAPSNNLNVKPPSLSDAPSMPYTAAVIHEVLRISTVIPMGIFHRAIEDVDFHGYRIPKDTLVLANVYGVHRDPSNWVQPDTFNPGRFLESTGKLNKASVDLIPFSFGKRSCFGEGFARDQLFLMCSSFFQQFTVSCTDRAPSLEGKFGFAYAPHEFELYVTERL